MRYEPSACTDGNAIRHNYVNANSDNYIYADSNADTVNNMKKTIILILIFVLLAVPFTLAGEQGTKLTPEQIQEQTDEANWNIASGVLMITSGSIIFVVDMAYLALQLADTIPPKVPDQGLGQESAPKPYVISTETKIWMTVFGVVGASLVGFGVNNCVNGGEMKEKLKKQMSITPYIYPDNGAGKYTYGLKMDLEF